MNDYIIYEQPVAVNIRNFLKCEYLYEKYSYALSQEDIWSIRSSISTLIEISDFVLRINLKVELLKELENRLSKGDFKDSVHKIKLMTARDMILEIISK